MVTRGWEEELVLNGYSFSLGRGTVLEIDGGDDVSNVNVVNTTIYFKMIKMVNFMLCIFCHKKNMEKNSIIGNVLLYFCG